MQSQQRNGMTHKQQGPYGSNWIIVVFYSVVVCVHHASIQPRLYSLNNYIISLLCFCLRCLCILFWNWMKSISTKKSKKKKKLYCTRKSHTKQQWKRVLWISVCVLLHMSDAYTIPTILQSMQNAHTEKYYSMRHTFHSLVFLCVWIFYMYNMATQSIHTNKLTDLYFFFATYRWSKIFKSFWHHSFLTLLSSKRTPM